MENEDLLVVTVEKQVLRRSRWSRFVERWPDPHLVIIVTATGCGEARSHPRSCLHHPAGLGLALAQDVVLEHGGTIEVRSQRGRFEVQLQLAGAAENTAGLLPLALSLVAEDLAVTLQQIPWKIVPPEMLLAQSPAWCDAICGIGQRWPTPRLLAINWPATPLSKPAQATAFNRSAFLQARTGRTSIRDNAA